MADVYTIGTAHRRFPVEGLGLVLVVLGGLELVSPLLFGLGLALWPGKSSAGGEVAVGRFGNQT